MFNITKVLLYFFIFLLFCSCVDNTHPSDLISDDLLRCNISIQNNNQTRGIPISSADDPLFVVFRIYARLSESIVNSFPTSGEYHIYGDEISKINNEWTFQTPRYWTDSYLNFIAFSPYSPAGVTVNADSYGIPLISYTVPSNVADQPDLMIAVSQINQDRVVVPIEFYHALSCVAFEVSGDNLDVESVSVVGVSLSADVSTVLSDDGNITWSNFSAISEDVLEVKLIQNPNDNSSFITPSDGYLMMIPQELTEDAVVIVTFSDSSQKRIPLLNGSISEWKPGYQYFYTLNDGLYDFDVVVSDPYASYTGDSFDISVNSYYTTHSGTVLPLDWTAEIISTTGQDNWLDGVDPTQSNQGGTSVPYLLNCGVSYYDTTSDIDLSLRSTDSIKFDEIRDLSYENSIYTTANTYAVNAPGWYKFPCFVMGNGILKSPELSINNTNCIYGNSFVDYKGNIITTPSINTQSANSTLLWEDSPGLISNVSLCDNNNYIRFYVSPEAIRQGNGVIAIRDNNNTIMWSWHIWVTNWKSGFGDQPFNYEDVNTSYMGYNIGRCSPAEYEYPTNTAVILFKQTSTGKEVRLTLTQNKEIITFGENNTYYQWGRKDPIIGTISNGTILDKPSFGPFPYEFTGTANNPLNYAINNPQKFICSKFWYSSTIVPYLWYISDTDGTIYKTIYDPSPAGYRVFTFDEMILLPDITYNFISQSSSLSLPDKGTFIHAGGTDVSFNCMGSREYIKGNITYLYTNAAYWTSQLYSHIDEHEVDVDESYTVDLHPYLGVNFNFNLNAYPYGQVNLIGLGQPVGVVRE